MSAPETLGELEAHVASLDAVFATLTQRCEELEATVDVLVLEQDVLARRVRRLAQPRVRRVHHSRRAPGDGGNAS
jgi:sulfur transfer complex TusBCD TusB component (DsrH family)